MNITDKKPNFVIFKNGIGYIINAFIETNLVDNIKVFKYITIDITYNFNYEYIVSALINYKYTQDQVTAITLNYLLTLHNEVLEPEKVKEYQQDYKELQEYRAACKAEAKKAIEYADINDIGPKL